MEELFLNNKRIDLPSTRVRQTYQINTLSDIKDRQLNYTDKFTLPTTPNNLKVLDFLGLLGNKSRKPYVKVPAKFIVDGIELMSNGYALVTKKDKKGFAVNILDGNAPLYEVLKGLKLSDLDMQDLNHFVNLTVFTNSFANTSGYIYAFGDFGYSNTSGIVNAERQAPSLFIHTVWDKIFTQAGFTYSGAIFSEASFLTEVMSIGKGYDVSDTTGTTDTSLGTATTNTLSRAGVFDDPVSFYDIFTPSGTLTDLTIVGNKIQADYTGILTAEISATYSVTDGEGYVKVELNGVIVKSIPLTGVINQTINLNVNDGDEVAFYLQSVTLFDSVKWAVDLQADLSIDFTKQSGGQYIDFSQIMPDTEQLNFIKDVMQSYGLFFQVDKTGKHYTFRMMEEMLNDRDSAEDWSNKFSNEISEDYKIGSYAQSNIMAYNYEEDVVPSHDGEMVVDNENLPFEKTLFTSIYKISQRTRGRVGEPIYNIPIWSEEEDDGGTIIVNEEADIRKFRIKNVDTTITYKFGTDLGTTDVTGIPFLSLDNLDYDFYISNYYAAFQSLLDKQLKRTVEMLLKPSDIYSLDFLTLKYLKQYGKYYYLNKVSNYTPNKLTKVELIEVNELSVNQPPNQLGNKELSLFSGEERALFLSHFTDTEPPYQDPEFDNPEQIKIVSGFNSDLLIKNNGIAITSETNLDANNLSLSLEDVSDGSIAYVKEFVFKIQSFKNSSFSTVTGKIIANVSAETNLAPIADAGGNKTLTYDSTSTGNGTVDVDGSNSYDPNGDTITYLWSAAWLPTGVVLSNETTDTATLTGTGLLFKSHNKTITLTLRVTDSLGLWSEDTTVVTLIDLSA